MALRRFHEEEETEPMSPKSRRPKSFHQSTLPKWGTHICTKTAVIDTVGASINCFGDRRSSSPNSYESTDAKGIADVREKLMHELKTDLKTATDRLKYAILNGESKAPVTSSDNANGDFTSLSRIEIDAVGHGFVDPISSRLRSNIPSNEVETPKFSLQLLRKQIDEDFMVLTGCRPRKRPTKRPRVVQKELDVSCMFPF